VKYDYNLKQCFYFNILIIFEFSSGTPVFSVTYFRNHANIVILLNGSVHVDLNFLFIKESEKKYRRFQKNISTTVSNIDNKLA